MVQTRKGPSSSAVATRTTSKSSKKGAVATAAANEGKVVAKATASARTKTAAAAAASTVVSRKKGRAAKAVTPTRSASSTTVTALPLPPQPPCASSRMACVTAAVAALKTTQATSHSSAESAALTPPVNTPAHREVVLGIAPIEEEVERGASFSLLQRYLPPHVLAASAMSVQLCDWNAQDAVSFSLTLAQAQCDIVRHWCRLLARLTIATSPAFLHVAALGEKALHTAKSRTETDTGSKSRRGNSSVEGPSEARDGKEDEEEAPAREHAQLLHRHAESYRTLRATIAASCALGHRSCQVLWGPRGCGKHRMLRLLAQEVRRTPCVFVVELNGALLCDDEAALGVMAQQLLTFLLSPSSWPLREASETLRHGTFGFAQLFRIDRRMSEAAGHHVEASEKKERLGGAPTAKVSSGKSGTHTNGGGAAGGRRGKELFTSAGKRRHVSSTSEDEEDEEDEETEDAEMMITSTTTYLTGGAASALPPLQRALLLLKGLGCSIVVCIREIDVFSIRCDQVLYVLSGLMHDSESTPAGNAGAAHGHSGGTAAVGGLSLVLASAAPDIRQLEKRLSSRLTCETRYVPLLPWTMTNLLAATVDLTAQEARYQLRLRELGIERTRLVASLREGAAQLRRMIEAATQRTRAAKVAAMEAQAELRAAMDELEARLQVVDGALRDIRIQRRHTLATVGMESLHGPFSGPGSQPNMNTSGVSTWWKTVLGSSLSYLEPSQWRPSVFSAAAPAVGDACAQHPSHSMRASSSMVSARTWTPALLHAHPTLFLELQCVLCEVLLRQLRRLPSVDAALRLPSAMEKPLSTSGTLLQYLVSTESQLALNTGTASIVLAALTDALCRAASGALDLMGEEGRRLVLCWMRTRLQHEIIPLSTPEDGPNAVMGNGARRCADARVVASALPAVVGDRWRETAQRCMTSANSAKDEIVGSEAKVAQTPSTRGILGEHTHLRPIMKATSSTGTDVLQPLPPHLFDLLGDGRLVGMGYGSRELILLLFYFHLHHTNGLRQRTVPDLLEDVSSSLGTQAAAALDKDAFRHAVQLLCRWRLLAMVDRTAQVVQWAGSETRLRDFLSTVLEKQPAWCEAELGLDTREMMRLRNLL